MHRSNRIRALISKSVWKLEHRWKIQFSYSHKLTDKFKSIRCFFVFCLHLPQSMVRSFYSSMLPHAIHFPNCFYRCYHKMYFGRELQNIQLNELLIRIHHRSMFENGIHTDVAFESKTQAI